MPGLNLLIDMLDTLDASTSSADTWQRLVGLYEGAGASFFVLGELDQATGEIIFLQSTMNRPWLDHWVDRNYANVDPHCPKKGIPPKKLETVTTLHSKRNLWPVDSDPKQRIFFDELAEAGYHGASSIPCPLGDTSRVRLVAFGAGAGDEGFMRSPIFHTLSLLAPVAALRGAQLEGRHPDIFIKAGPKLSTRERDVLSLLASGQLNARIAERLKITEPTVRKHVTSARIKLGCATREQAVAVAVSRGLISL